MMESIASGLECNHQVLGLDRPHGLLELFNVTTYAEDYGKLLLQIIALKMRMWSAKILGSSTKSILSMRVCHRISSKLNCPNSS